MRAKESILIPMAPFLTGPDFCRRAPSKEYESKAGSKKRVFIPMKLFRRTSQIRPSIFSLFLLTFLSWNIAWAQPISVTAELSNNEILIGDEVVMSIYISYEPGVEIQSLGLGILEELEKVEVKSIKNADTISNASITNFEQQILLTSFDSGVYKIPPIPIEYLEGGQSKKVSTNPLQLIVNTISVVMTDSTDIQPIKEILREPIGIEEIYPYLLGALGVALITMAIVYFIRRRNRPKEVQLPPVPVLKAHEIAQQKIEQLKGADLLAQKAFKDYQTELTYILREYLENRYDIAALESTTVEIVRSLKKAGFPDGWQLRLKDMLQKADLVKFAKADYSIHFHEDALDAVANFVEETKEKEEQVEESEEDTTQNEESSE